MPRQHKRPTDIDLRQRNASEIQGWPGDKGKARIGGSARRGGGRSVVADGTAENEEGSNAAQLLVMSATDDSIAAGGDVVEFDTVIAQHGFDGVVQPSGGYWVHPVSGVYVLVYEHAWASYEGGGTIRLVVDDDPIPEGVIASGVDGAQGSGSICYHAEAGSVGAISVAHSDASAQVCDARVHVAITDPTEPASPSAVSELTLLDTFEINMDLHSVADGTFGESAATLASATEYVVLIDGNYTVWADTTLAYGSPEPVMYGSASGDMGWDAETVFADRLDRTLPRHTEGDGVLQLNLGSGWSHVEPDGGAVTTPTDGHLYTYTLTGQGSTLKGATTSTVAGNGVRGVLRVRIYEGG